VSVRELDPRASLAWLLVSVGGALFCGDVGLGAALALALMVLWRSAALGDWLRLLRALLPLAVVVVGLDFVASGSGLGVRTAARLVTLASLGLAFTRMADAERLLAGLAALRVPYRVSFVLVNGARFVPAVWEDVSALRDAARLRGVRLDGPPWRQAAGWRRLLVPLLVTTVRRGLQLGEAMEARAFGALPARTRRYALTWRRRDSAALAAAVAYAVGIGAGAVLLRPTG
jgi:energy-coupling factor transport system permease protein